MRNLLYIIILFLITACGYSASDNHTLDEAKSLMHSDPSAALAKLNGLDVSEFNDSATMAKWAFLYSEAMIMNRYAAPTDTIINIAIDYYSNHNLTEDYHKALQLKALNQATDETDALATAIYLQKEKEFFLYKERVKREETIFIFVIVIIVALACIVWMRQRLKLQTLRNDALLLEVSSFRSEIEAGRGAVNRLESKLHGLLENRFALIDSLCQTYYETRGTKAERNAIIDKVKSEIESVRTDSFSQMEKAVNDCRDNLLVIVKGHYPDIKPQDYQLLVYHASGLSTRTISLLLDESVDVIYKRKSRLKTRIKDKIGTVCPDISGIF